MLTHCIFVVLCILPRLRGEDSLKSAVNAVVRRHRDITTTDYRPYGMYDMNLLNNNRAGGPREYIDDDGYGVVTSDSDSAGYSDGGSTEFEKALLDFLEEKGVLERESYDGRNVSPFRERVEEDKHKQHDKIVEILHDREDEEHAENLRKLFDKYRKQYMENYEEPTYDVAPRRGDKRSYYPNLGYGSVGMSKRSRYYEADGPRDPLLLLSYAPRDDIYNRGESDDEDENDDDDVDDVRWNRLHPSRARPMLHIGRKRTAIAKRSSEYASQKTDPKTEKDLNDIFNPKNKTSNATQASLSKEIMPKSMPPEKPLEMKKKSVDWSKYFGLDRRKKSDDEFDEDWLIDRYYKTKANTKRNPKPIVRTHAREVKKESKAKLFGNPDDAKMKDMDEKLKNIEESIVDDTLKYTGAHEGAVDSKELQEVKDRIISRLAAAYSLEKMRRALGEYKSSLALAATDNGNGKEADNELLAEDKRASVPRKQAVDHERALADKQETNKIKCSAVHGDAEDCDQQNFKAPIEFLEENNYNKESCPGVVRACDEVGSVLGPYGKVINSACIMHQMCLLCGDNSWMTPTRQCNALFLSKADELCGGDQECERVARMSVRYLLHVSRSLRSEPLHDCDLSCPQI